MGGWGRRCVGGCQVHRVVACCRVAHLQRGLVCVPDLDAHPSPSRPSCHRCRLQKPAQASAPGSGLSAPGFMPATTNPLAAIARAGRTGVALTPSEALAFAKSGGPRLTRASSKKGFVGGDEPSDSEASAPPS